MKFAYYNEFEPSAAEGLRNLIKARHIADGIVDERSIVDVRPEDLKEFTQCHFFAGIGGWSYALRQAGWYDNQPVWTGSPPCQPFSTAGKQLGVKDDRHLTPVWLNLVKECRPAVLFGEQVAAATTKDEWLDTLQNALEAENYATGSIVLPACSVGAPGLRQRLWFVAERVGESKCKRLQGYAGNGTGRNQPGREQKKSVRPVGATGEFVRLADTEISGDGTLNRKPDQGVRPKEQDRGRGLPGGMADTGSKPRKRGAGGLPAKEKGVSSERKPNGYNPVGHPNGRKDGGMADTDGSGSQPGRETSERPRHGHPFDSTSGADPDESTDPLNGFWQDADWLLCRDGKWRPVEPGTFPLANGVPNRVGRLRGYGNAIVPQIAAEVIKSFIERNEI